MGKIIFGFSEFNTKLKGIKMQESDGFGTSPFLMVKKSDVYHYFFNIESEDEKEMGYHLIIGKYSNNDVIDGAKNSYCVLTLNQISHEIIDDIAINKEEVPETNSMMFRLKGSEVSRVMEYCSKCILNYLEINSKVNRIYDEIQDNLVFKGKGNYVEFMKSIILSYLGSNWSVQEGSSKKSVLISR